MKFIQMAWDVRRKKLGAKGPSVAAPGAWTLAGIHSGVNMAVFIAMLAHEKKWLPGRKIKIAR